MVKKDEVENINQALVEAAQAMKKQAPAIIYTIVNKGTHSVRFMQKPESRGLSGRDAKNPAPGVCVEIRSDAAPGGAGSEFFLNPSPCTLSTCKPVRYIIVTNKRANEDEDFSSHPPVTLADFKQCEW